MDINNIDQEKLLYFIILTSDYIPTLIDNVLNDSKEDPHCSAVAATNVIKCYIEISTSLGRKLPYNDVKGYFRFELYTEEEYLRFEQSRKSESEYYGGPQY